MDVTHIVNKALDHYAKRIIDRYPNLTDADKMIDEFSGYAYGETTSDELYPIWLVSFYGNHLTFNYKDPDSQEGFPKVNVKYKVLADRIRKHKAEISMF